MNDTEEILDILSTQILDLGSIREQTTDAVDRAALNNQIMALTKLWRKIDDTRAGKSDPQLAEAKSKLQAISRDLKKEKQQLKHIAQVVYKTAQAIAVAEQIVKLIA